MVIKSTVFQRLFQATVSQRYEPAIDVISAAREKAQGVTIKVAAKN